MSAKKASGAAPQETRGCLRSSKVTVSEKSSRRVSFFERAHVRQIGPRKSQEDTDTSVFSSNNNKLNFQVPELSASGSSSPRRRSIFGLHFDEACAATENTDSNNAAASNAGAGVETSFTDGSVTSFEQESFEMPLKAGDGLQSEISRAPGEVDAPQVLPDFADDSSSSSSSPSSPEMMDGDIGDNECSLESPTGSDIMHIQKSLQGAAGTPVICRTPLRSSYTHDSGWTTSHSAAVVSPLPAANADVSMQLDDHTVDMELTEPIRGDPAVVVAGRRRSSVAPSARLSTASATMDVTVNIGSILEVQNMSPVRQSPRLHQASSSSSSRRDSVASAVNLTANFGAIAAADSSTPSREVPTGVSSSRLSTPMPSSQITSMSRKVKSTSSTTIIKSSTPLRSSPRLSTGKRAASSVVSTTPIKSSSNMNSPRPSGSVSKKSRPSDDVVEAGVFEVDEESSPTKNKSSGSKLTKKASTSTTASDVFQSSYCNELEASVEEDGEALPSTADNNNASVNDWIDNISFQQAVDDEDTRRLSITMDIKSTMALTPKKLALSSVNSPVEQQGRISIISTPMKVSNKTLSSAFMQHLGNEKIPASLQFPELKPSPVDEYSKFEIEACERLVNEWQFLLEREMDVINLLVRDVERSDGCLFAAFENDYAAFVSMLEVAFQDASVDTMQDIVNGRLAMFDMYTQVMGGLNADFAENCKIRKDLVSPVQFVQPVEAVLEEQKIQFEKLEARRALVSELSIDQYQEAMFICDTMRQSIVELEQSVKDMEREIERLDTEFANVSRTISSKHREKDSIAFDYEEIPTADNDLEEARENYELLRKISCWSIKDVKQDELQLEYRAGLAHVSVSKAGTVKTVQSKLSIKPCQSPLMVWRAIDEAICHV